MICTDWFLNRQENIFRALSTFNFFEMVIFSRRFYAASADHEVAVFSVRALQKVLLWFIWIFVAKLWTAHVAVAPLVVITFVISARLIGLHHNFFAVSAASTSWAHKEVTSLFAGQIAISSRQKFLFTQLTAEFLVPRLNHISTGVHSSLESTLIKHKLMVFIAFHLIC